MSEPKANGILRPAHAATRSILKAMGVFGGVRMFAILCSLVRNKLIAIWVGPAGVGLVILYNSFIELIGQISRLSIDQSAVRDITASSRKDLDTIVKVVKVWSWILGVLGALAMCLLSPLLSLWSFGNYSHWPVFCMLSAVPMFMTVFMGFSAILQGLRQFTTMARMNVVIALLGIAASVPLIYFLREDSIKWVILSYGVANLACVPLFRVKFKHVALTLRQIWEKGRQFIGLGILITVGTASGLLFNYLFVLFLNRYASVDTLGIYQAGFTLVNTYVGVLFTGIWMEYFPRLTATVHSVKRTSATVSNQLSVTVWVLMPVVAFFIAADKLIVNLLYADTFMTMLPYVTLGIVGTVLRGSSWCFAHVMLARGDGRVYVVSETLSGVVFIVLHSLMYMHWGFAGLGVAYVLWYAFYTVFTYWIYRRRYGYTVSAAAWRSVAIAMLFCAACVAAKIVAGWWLPAVLGAAILPFAYKRVFGR